MRIPEGHVELLRALQSHLQSCGARGWLVGGYVRDLFLGRVSGDIDIAVDGDALALSRSFADTTGGSWVPLDEKRNAARIVWPTAAAGAGWPRIVDLARLRAPTLEGDLRGRDFTINALAVPLDQAGNFDGTQLIDPLGGLHDLRQGILRLCSPRAILDDWLRMLRAVRLGALLDFRLADDLDAELRARHALIKDVAAERVRDELLKLLALPHAARWVRYLDEVGLLTSIIPELEPARTCDQPVVHFLPVLAHLLEAVVAAEWLIWG
ncbi:MAG: polynucleotide adenylyltransferase, partial [Chloroflexota bacterium]|nr:polynucleotide adenylyltransferase [Chloroflexota bacterium]